VLAHLGRRAQLLGCLTLALLASTATPPVTSPGSAADAPPIAADAAPESEGPGPALLTPRSARTNALTCYGILDDAERPPVLLIPGTAVTASENWAPTYLPVLLDRGHGVCTIDLPDYATRDVQANSEFVATAIRTMTARAMRKLSIAGHSQGAFLAHVALRTWPDLSAHVEDVIGLAGVYDHGSERLADRCELRCTPVLHQLATGSRYLSHISKRWLPTGPSYTNIGTLGDLTVTPQPAANEQPGATSILVQDVCPGRTLPISEHAMIAGDSAALALTLDALDHDGTASLSRVDPAVCETGEYPEFNSVQYLAVTALTGLRAGTSSEAEPTLYCRSRPTCRYPRLRGFLTRNPRYTIARTQVTIRIRVQLPGRIKIVLGRRIIKRTVQPGPVTLRIRRPAKRAQLVVKTRPRHYTAWAAEDTRWVRARAS